MFKNFNNNKLGFILAIILMLISVITVGIILFVNVLPIKYLLLVITFILGIVSFISCIQFRQIKVNKTLNIITGISVGAILILFIYFVNTFNFLELVTKSGYKVQNYSVIVLKDKSYDKIQDLSGKNLGYINGDDEGVKLALDNIVREVTTIQILKNDVIDLSNALFSNDLEAIMIEKSYNEILNEEVENFANETKIIYEFSVKVKVDETTRGVKSVTKDSFNIYISGIDTYGDINSVSRSDVNMVVTVNPNTKQVLLTNIPRDYYVTLPGTDSKDKLTHAGIYGIEKSVTTVENILDIDINYYVKVNFTSLEEIVNSLGGITAYSKYSFTSYIGNYKFNEGYNNMNGAQALAFSRERKAFAEGDIMRGKNQQAVIEAIIRKVSSPSIIYKYNSILNSLSGKFQTNMSMEEILQLVKFQLDKNISWNVTAITLNGVGSSEYTYSAGKQKLYVLIPDSETINNAKSLIKDVINGKRLDSSYGEVKSPTNPVKENESFQNNETIENNQEDKVQDMEEENNTILNENITNSIIDNEVSNEIENDIINNEIVNNIEDNIDNEIESDITNNEIINDSIIDEDATNKNESEELLDIKQ